MEEKSVVIYDSNTEYAKRLVNYLEYNNTFKVKLFTNAASLEDYMREKREDIYILEDCGLSRQMITMYNLNSLLITGDRQARELGVYKFIYKYLPASDLISRINLMMESDKVTENEEFMVCALVSPVHRMDVDNIMYRLSYQSEHRVCVVDFRGQQMWISFNMEDNNENESPDTKALADVLYAVHEDNDGLSELVLKNMIAINSFKVLFGLVEENDVSAVTPKDLDCLIDSVVSTGMFDRMIIICDTNLLVQLRQSIAGSDIIAVTRGKDNEKFVCRKLMEQGVTFKKTIITGKIERILDLVWSDEVEAGYECDIQEVTDVFISEGIV